MEGNTLLLLVLIVGVSSFVHGLTGFGIGIVLMFFLPMVLGYQTSVIVCLACVLVMGCVLLVPLWKRVNWQKTVPIMVPVLIIQFAFTKFLFHLHDNYLKIILGVIMLFFAVLFILSGRNLQIRASKINGVVCGIAAGVCNTLGVGGPPLSYYCHSVFDNNLDYLANLQVCLLLSCGFLLLQHFLSGNVTAPIMADCAVASVVCIVVLFPTMRLFRSLDRGGLTKIITVFLAVMGIGNILI